jgi:hypothetical protein
MMAKVRRRATSLEMLIWDSFYPAREPTGLKALHKGISRDARRSGVWSQRSNTPRREQIVKFHLRLFIENNFNEDYAGDS